MNEIQKKWVFEDVGVADGIFKNDVFYEFKKSDSPLLKIPFIGEILYKKCAFKSSIIAGCGHEVFCRSKELGKLNLPKGKYRVNLTIEKIDEKNEDDIVLNKNEFENKKEGSVNAEVLESSDSRKEQAEKEVQEEKEE